MRRFLPYIGPLIGLTGISLGLYFHAVSVQERQPLFYIGPRATIVDGSVAVPSQLQVLYRGRPLGATNVVAVVIYFWNDGRMPIRTADVLEPISIQLDRSCEILESRLLKVSREVTRFEKKEVSETAKYALPISFDILEKGDGAAIQIIYARKSDALVSLTGTIVGAGTPRMLSKEVQSGGETRRNKFRGGLIAGGSSIGMGVLTIVLSLFRLRRLDRNPNIASISERRGFMFGIIGGAIVYILLGLYIAHDAYQTYSPGVPLSIWSSS